MLVFLKSCLTGTWQNQGEGKLGRKMLQVHEGQIREPWKYSSLLRPCFHILFLTSQQKYKQEASILIPATCISKKFFYFSKFSLKLNQINSYTSKISWPYSSHIAVSDFHFSIWTYDAEALCEIPNKAWQDLEFSDLFLFLFLTYLFKAFC